MFPTAAAIESALFFAMATPELARTLQFRMPPDLNGMQAIRGKALKVPKMDEAAAHEAFGQSQKRETSPLRVFQDSRRVKTRLFPAFVHFRKGAARLQCAFGNLLRSAMRRASPAPTFPNGHDRRAACVLRLPNAQSCAASRVWASRISKCAPSALELRHGASQSRSDEVDRIDALSR